MQPFSGSTIGHMGFFFGVKTPKISDFFVMSNLSLPASICFLHPRNAANPFHAVFVVVFAVCSVLPARCFAKVAKSVVGFVSVNVVNLAFGHFSGYIKPRKPMSGIRFPVYFNINISIIFFEVARSISNLYFRARQRPFENPCLGVIGKYGKKVRMFHSGNLPEHRWDCNRQEGALCSTTLG